MTLCQLGPLIGISKSAIDRVIDHLGPLLALQPRKRFPVPQGHRAHRGRPLGAHPRPLGVAEQSKNYRYATVHQVVIDADSRMGVAVAQSLPGREYDSTWQAWTATSMCKAARGRCGPRYESSLRRPPYRRAPSRPEYPEYLEGVTAQAAEARFKDRRPSPGQEDRPLGGTGCLPRDLHRGAHQAGAWLLRDGPPTQRLVPGQLSRLRALLTTQARRYGIAPPGHRAVRVPLRPGEHLATSAAGCRLRAPGTPRQLVA
uniref:Putative transposase n=1 Tax=Streptomyces platensis TaxID=58346 RepID=D3Y142_STRPT|nr:putative transposase [Streptomyces platensis]